MFRLHIELDNRAELQLEVGTAVLKSDNICETYADAHRALDMLLEDVGISSESVTVIDPDGTVWPGKI